MILLNFVSFFYLSALAIYARSPAAFRAVRSLGILQLPCTKYLQHIISKNADGPGVHEDYIAHQRQEYENFTKTQVDAGKKRPLGVGVLVFDETKVRNSNHNKVL